MIYLNNLRDLAVPDDPARKIGSCQPLWILSFSGKAGSMTIRHNSFFVNRIVQQLYALGASRHLTVEYWRHEFACRRTTLANISSPDQPLIDNMTQKSRSSSSAIRFQQVGSIAGFLRITPVDCAFSLQ
jgi:hypothetical protein